MLSFFVLLQSLSVCFASDVLTFEERVKINNNLKKGDDIHSTSKDFEEKARKIFQATCWEKDYVKFFLEKHNQKIGRDDSFSFFYDPSIFENFLEEDKIQKDNNKLWFYYSVEGALYFAKEERFDAAKKSFLKALEIEPKEVRNVLSYMTATTINSKFYGVNVASYRALASLYEDIRNKTPSFKEYDAIDLINLGFLYDIGKDSEKSLNFLLKSLEKKWPDKSDHEFKIQMEKSGVFRSIADIYYEIEEYEEFKKIVFRSDYGKFLLADDYLHLAHIYGLEKDWKTASSYLIKIVSFLSKGESIHIKNAEMALCLVEICHKSELPKEIKDIFIRLLKDNIPPLREEIDTLVKELNGKNFKTLRRTIVSHVYHQKLEKIQAMPKDLDEIYEKLWLKASLIPETQGQLLLTSLNDCYEKFQEAYKVLEPFEISPPKDMKSFNKQYNTLIKIKEDIELVSRKIILENNIHYIQTNKQELPLHPEIFIQSNNASKKLSTRKALSIDSFVSDQSSASSSAVQEKGFGIQSFANTQTKEIWDNKDAQTYSIRVLDLLDALNSANSMFDLGKKVSKGANLEKLQGGSGLLSLRINDQWRLCFKWVSGKGAYDVAVVDYH